MSLEDQLLSYLKVTESLPANCQIFRDVFSTMVCVCVCACGCVYIYTQFIYINLYLYMYLDFICI